MTYIKKLIMQGFKSFAPRTELIFDNGINLFVGPNGSGKSNISDALCFALGRISAKSMRASKSGNLLFMGSKYAKPAKEAIVEIIFDNAQKTFGINTNEVSLKRTVRRNGQSIYRINDEVKTRSEILETLAQAGIDPYGFNAIPQGSIQSIVKMHPEERRKIIEEVSGISVYESRKEKSLHELEKTEERLKEVNTILRERTAFLRNLENERSQALRFKELEKTIQRCKASLLNRKIEEKNQELLSLKKSISEKLDQKSDLRAQTEELQAKIDSYNEQISQINKHIQKSTGIEQETLHTSVANLKAEIEGIKVRKENHENKLLEIEKRINQMEKSIPELNLEIKELRQKSPLMARKQAELSKKKEELDKIQEERKNVYTVKTQLLAIKERLKDKERQLARLNADSETNLKQIEELSSELKHDTEEKCEKSIASLSNKLKSAKLKLEEVSSFHVAQEKIISISENQIQEAERIKSQVSKLNLCPLCQTSITDEHIAHVHKDSDNKIENAGNLIEKSKSLIKEFSGNKIALSKEISSFESDLFNSERELVKHKAIEDKMHRVKSILQDQDFIKKELNELEGKKNSLESKTFDISLIEERYTQKMQEIEEISSRNEENLDTTLLYKERELERIKEVIKRSKQDYSETESDVEELSSSFDEKIEMLESKEAEEKQLNDKFKQLFRQRDELQEKIKEENYNLSSLQSGWGNLDEQINYLKVGNAKLEAEKEALEMEITEFAGIELIKASVNALQEKLAKAKEDTSKIGSINMRALEVYDEIKVEYDRVKEKSDNIEKEKLEILKIVEEIDKKKKKTFMKTFNSINELFSQNFSKLYSKGFAYLETENMEDPFQGGVNIVIKLAKGKYFDISSLSGGEQTLVAVSLMFAIQEFKPYHFYILDEIDAALDKRNSERLSALIRQYIKKGQYIVITHNDALITNSDILYGVSMHEGISKILSLKIADNAPSEDNFNITPEKSIESNS